MTTVEKKLNLLLELALAEDEESRAKIRKTIASQFVPSTGRENQDAAIRRSVESMCLRLGVPCHILGRAYLMTGLAMVVKNYDLVYDITKGFYTTVAGYHGTTASRVERAIRHAIEVTWTRADPDVLAEVFGNTIAADKGKPTNSEFVARVALTIRDELGIQ